MRQHFCLDRTFIALFLLVISACSVRQDDTPPETACAPSDISILLDEWRFQTDPANSGIESGWNQVDFDDSGWSRDVQPGRSWDEQRGDYDGIGWYRLTLTLPDWEAVYLPVSGVDDAGALWVNGEEAGAWDLLEPGPAYVNLRDFAPAETSVTLAFQVEDRGGFGGLKESMRIGPTLQSAMSDMEYLSWLAGEHPDWPMPGWTRGRPLSWTMTGGLNQSDETLVSMDGAVAPWARAPLVEAWFVNAATGEISGLGAETAPLFSLVDGDLPIPQWSWQFGDATVKNTLFHDPADGALRWRIESNLEAVSTELKLVVVIRPFAVNRLGAPVYQLSALDSSRLWLNGKPFLLSHRPPEQVGVGRLEEVMPSAIIGRALNTNRLDCDPAGEGAAALIYDLPSGQIYTLDFSFPTIPGAAFPENTSGFAEKSETARQQWREETHRLNLSIPDERVQAAYHASIGYLLLANDPNGPHPGPLAHNALWVRDAAYIGLALIQAGHEEIVRGYLSTIFSAQESSGRILPILGDDAPWQDDEWDSQGQAIFLATSLYRYTADAEILRGYYPQMRLSAAFIQTLRQVNARAESPIRGLLPPSLSAEDLGPADRHYYWDNFWAIIGLEEAAFAAELLDKTEDAGWMRAEAADLRRAVMESIEAVMGAEAAYIPASVEDRDSAAMARGTVAAVWPVEIFPPDTPLLQRAFDFYHQRWLIPHNGGFIHREGQFWPYGGTELAHAYLRLGRGDALHQILGWTLSNQTLPGTYAWAEQVSPSNGGFSGGDMPHAWAAASIASLVREMIVMERGEALHLFNSAPGWWFEAERVISLTGAPTHFGPLTLRTESLLETVEDRWQGELVLSLSGAAPPEGFFWEMGRRPEQVEGPEGTRLEETVLWIPPSGGTVKLIFGG